jgi:hypothetical protein
MAIVSLRSRVQLPPGSHEDIDVCLKVTASGPRQGFSSDHLKVGQAHHARIVDHINSELEIDEVIDLWRPILPRHRNLWYDEVEERIHYNEEAEGHFQQDN